MQHSFGHFQQGRNRWLVWAAGFLLIGILLYLAITTWVSKEIAAQIRSAHGSTSSVDVSLLKRSITITHLQWHSVSESERGHSKRGHSIQARKISISGIHLIELLFHKRVVIESMQLDSAKVVYDRSTKSESNKTTSGDYRSLVIQQLTFTQVDCFVKSDTLNHLSAELNGTLSSVELSLSPTAAVHYHARSADIVVSKIGWHRQEGMYGATMARLHIQTEKQRIQVDSVLLIPNYGKYEFAHQLGKQTDRITLIVPKLILEGVNFKSLADSVISISKVQIESFNLVAFRDKRVPSRDETYVPLPMKSFLDFPYKVQIDSVQINHSMVSVEEIPEDRSVSSRITFEDIHASLTHFYNRPSSKNEKPALLHATGLLMGEGQIDALFVLPLDSTTSYKTIGSIKKMYFAKLNPALEPLANLRMESGYLNEMTFSFNYNDLFSKGVLEIDYQDLRLTALAKDHRSTREMRTWLLNTLVKNDRNHTLASAKHPGEINIPRDRQRFIFNIWWKSIRDGLKSIVMRTGKIDKRKHTKKKK